MVALVSPFLVRPNDIPDSGGLEVPKPLSLNVISQWMRKLRTVQVQDENHLEAIVRYSCQMCWKSKHTSGGTSASVKTITHAMPYFRVTLWDRNMTATGR